MTAAALVPGLEGWYYQPTSLSGTLRTSGISISLSIYRPIRRCGRTHPRVGSYQPHQPCPRPNRIVGRWLADCTDTGPTCSATAAQLRESHEQWCADNGETPLSAKALGTELEHRGFDSARVRRARTWLGIGLLPDDDEDA